MQILLVDLACIMSKEMAPLNHDCHEGAIRFIEAAKEFESEPLAQPQICVAEIQDVQIRDLFPSLGCVR